MRPALDGHSGIPQETRLLFRGLAGLPGVQAMGLLQSGNLVLEPGLPLNRDGSAAALPPSAQTMDRLSKVVVSLQQGALSHRLEWLRKRFLLVAGSSAAVGASLLGRPVPLTRFDPAPFTDFVWRGLFAKTLPVEDLDIVTRCDFRVMRWPWSALNALGVVTGFMGHAAYPRLDTRGIDLMIAETPYPGRVRRGTQLVVRYHDAFPVLMPHTVKDRGWHRALHFRALQRNAADGAWFACVSDATRRDLLQVMPHVEARALTIPNIVAHPFHAGPHADPAPAEERVPEIIWSRKNRSVPHEGGAAVHGGDLVQGKLPYLLMVSTIEPRKNHMALLDAWELLRAAGFPRLNLVCVGGLGWDHGAMLKRFAPWLQRGGLHLLEGVPADDLRVLYRHAAVTVCPSFGEGFDFSGVEAMGSGGVVAASDIPVHREVFGDAAAYFSPYSAKELAAELAGLLGAAGRGRCELLRSQGAEVAARHRLDRVMPSWQAFLERLAPGPASAAFSRVA
jgi:glycosyltransferase involved in cell wall biosynthesis